MDLTIIGAGRAAWTFGKLWQHTGGEIRAIHTRRGGASEAARLLATDERPLRPEALDDAGLVLFALPDRAISETWSSLREAIPSTAVLFHSSGALTSSLFARRFCFSLHPLRSLPPVGTERLELTGTLFTWEGDPATLDLAGRFVSAAGGVLRRVDPQRKLLYHAAAVFGSNYVAALLEEARLMMEEAGLEDTRAAVAILAGSAISNWASTAEAEGFTGPIRRGDTSLIEDHLKALSNDPDRLALYKLLGRSILRAVKEDPDSIGLQEIEHLLRRTEHP
jgi:predicted short-subunit dehydrogenase-like oxidoreductase (DUF2520 family)